MKKCKVSIGGAPLEWRGRYWLLLFWADDDYGDEAQKLEERKGKSKKRKAGFNVARVGRYARELPGNAN